MWRCRSPTGGSSHPDRRQHLGGVVCEPDRDPGPEYLNLWKGFTVEPCDGDPGPILDHVRFIASGAGAEAEEYLLNWTALALQRPGSPGEVAVVMRGAKGVGKGVYGNMMLRLFGVHGFYASHQRDLAGNFNAHLMNACLVFADECFFAGDAARIHAQGGDHRAVAADRAQGRRHVPGAQPRHPDHG